MIDVGALWGVKGWTKPQWCGPFKTAAGAVKLALDEGYGLEHPSMKLKPWEMM